MPSKLLAPLRATKLGRILIDVFDWYPASYPVEERRLLRKLDRSILIFTCLSFFCKYLDQSNITNAYVSGMKEEIGATGNALNYFQTSWTVAYIIGQFPLVWLSSRPSLSPYFLPTMEVIWAILTFSSSRVTKTYHMYIIRALIGFFEAPSFAGTHFVLGSWFKKEELFKRAGVWFMGNSLGTCFSGYLQAAAYNTLNGRLGLSGWRWLFIIDGVITLPIAFIGYFYFPGLPSSKKPWYFTDEEHALAVSRMDKHHKQAGPVTWDVVKRVVKNPVFYICGLIYISMCSGAGISGYMSLWLKSEPKKWSVALINVYPTFISLMSAITSWLGTTFAAHGGYMGLIYQYTFACFTMVFGAIVLTIWNVPDGLKFFAFYFTGLAGAISPVFFSWINTVLRYDAEQRALIMAATMVAGYTGSAVIPIFTFPTVEAPRYPKGYPSSIAFSLLLWIAFVGGVYITRRTFIGYEPQVDVESPTGSIAEKDGSSDEDGAVSTELAFGEKKGAL